MTATAPAKIDTARLDKFKRNVDIVMLAYAREFPFWGVMSERCSFSCVAGKEHFCQTACIDKFGNITFNLDFYDTLTDKQFLTLVAHEISHFIFEHSGRLGSRDAFQWNCATDFAINLMLKFQFEKSEFYLKDWLLDDKYEGMTAERIYEEIEKDGGMKQKGGRVWIVDLAGDGDSDADENGEMPQDGDTVIVRDRRVPLPKKEPGKSKEQFDSEMKDYIKQAICEAYACAKSQGLMPAGMERIIVGHLKPKVNWLQALRQRLRMGASRKSSRDITWSVPNRRFLGASYIFPSNMGPDQPKIAFAIDTSGSMSQKDLEQAIAELEDIRRKFNAKVYFLDCDAGVYESRWIDPYEPLPALQGGGGTDFAPVFEHLVEKKIRPDYCVFFTDGYGNFGDDPTSKFDVLWVLTNQQVNPPFGDVVRVAVDNDSN
jgi:predicted metal-dependent peptidase